MVVWRGRENESGCWCEELDAVFRDGQKAATVQDNSGGRGSFEMTARVRVQQQLRGKQSTVRGVLTMKQRGEEALSERRE